MAAIAFFGSRLALESAASFGLEKGHLADMALPVTILATATPLACRWSRLSLAADWL